MKPCSFFLLFSLFFFFFGSSCSSLPLVDSKLSRMLPEKEDTGHYLCVQPSKEIQGCESSMQMPLVGRPSVHQSKSLILHTIIVVGQTWCTVVLETKWRQSTKDSAQEMSLRRLRRTTIDFPNQPVLF